MKNAEQFGVTSLGSGSKGNATLVSFADTLLLIDSGYFCKELESRMCSRNIEPKKVTAVLVTHEHGDHFKGVPAFANKYKLPVWLSAGTALHKSASKIKQLEIFNSHQSFCIQDISILPVAVPHDAREACQFVFEANQKRIGLLTDLGQITPYIRCQFQACDILLLEFNHDSELLLNGRYPSSLKSRVAGNFGHLSNMQSSRFLDKQVTKKLKHLVAMHLSEENNWLELVRESIASAQLKAAVKITIADQNNGFDWICF